jgi:hypothetical protein
MGDDVETCLDVIGEDDRERMTLERLGGPIKKSSGDVVCRHRFGQFDRQASITDRIPEYMTRGP